MARRPSDEQRAINCVNDVREWLRKHEVSQRALSIVAGVHPTHMNRWMRGHSLPSLENQERLREAMAGFVG